MSQLEFYPFYCLPKSANLTEVAGQLGKMVKHLKFKSTLPTLDHLDHPVAVFLFEKARKFRILDAIFGDVS